MLVGRTRVRRRWMRALGVALVAVPVAAFLLHPVIQESAIQIEQRRAASIHDVAHRRKLLADPLTGLAPPPDPNGAPALEPPEAHVRRIEPRVAVARAGGPPPLRLGDGSDPIGGAIGGGAATAESDAEAPLSPPETARESDAAESSSNGAGARTLGRPSRLGPAPLQLAERPAFDGSPVPTHADPRPLPAPGTAPLAEPELWPTPPDISAPALRVDPYSR